MRIVRGRGSELRITKSVVRKTFTDESKVLARRRAQHEISFYLAAPWACPKLLDHGHNWLEMERLRPASRVRGWEPDYRLWSLLERLGREGIHHRDSHGANIVLEVDGYPRLIDWDAAIRWPSPLGLSYDLYGPEVSGVPRPPQHWTRSVPVWWSEAQKSRYPRPIRGDASGVEPTE